MTIIIPKTELKEEFQSPIKMSCVSDLCIDYATNSIHGWFEGKECIVFEFKKYGFINDNRCNTYEISSGSAGIYINII